MGKAYRRIRDSFCRKGMREKVSEFVRNCSICQEQKLVRVKTREPMVITDTPTEVLSKVAIDTMGPLSKTPHGDVHILAMQCLLSKFCIGIPVPDIKAITIADALARHFIAAYGTPKVFLSNRGTSFRSQILNELAKIFGFKLATATAYHPKGNGSLERSHGNLCDYLRTEPETKQDWDELIPSAMPEYNTSVH